MSPNFNDKDMPARDRQVNIFDHRNASINQKSDGVRYTNGVYENKAASIRIQMNQIFTSSRVGCVRFVTIFILELGKRSPERTS